MKNLPNLSLSLLLLVVLGCSCPAKFAELTKKGKDTEPPPRSTPSTSSTPAPDSGDDDVSKDKFAKIKAGMKRSEVEAIMGGEGSVYYKGTGGGVSFVSVKYSGANYKTIFISYRNDKVTSKSQVGLD